MIFEQVKLPRILQGRTAFVILAIVCRIVVSPAMTHGQQKLYWTHGSPNEIQRANLDGTGVEVLVSGLFDGPFGITLDLAAERMYWAEENGHRIVRANLDGTGIDPIITGLPGFPADVALDLDAGKVYWVEFAGSTISSVKRANLDGTEIEDLVPLIGSGNRNGITLDLSAGKIYWTLCAGNIRRANLDGSDVEDILSGLGCLVDIELDARNGKMYWSDSTLGSEKIQRANLDGTEIEDLVTTGLALPFEIALDLGVGQLFWSNSGVQKIQRANLDGTDIVDLVTGVGGLWGLALDLRLFADGFESGNTSAWSFTVP